MTNLKGKHIVLGISGSIAAYKSMELIQLLKEKGSEVRVVVTKSAKKFITPLSLQTISCHPVLENLFTIDKKGTILHIELAKWADFILIAPATANILAKLALGLSNDLLSNLCLATTAPIAVAPSMNQQMYQSIATQSNLHILRSREILVWGPEYGYQACKDIGLGRMTEPKIIIEHIIQYFSSNNINHLNIMVTAGPTYEALDPIRFFSNYSSGKMGFAIAQAATHIGANVTLITGPVHLNTPHKVHRINVISALDMHKAVIKNIKNQHIFIGCAAVSDYRVHNISIEKIKKQSDTLTINMIKNPDIISQVGSLKNNRPYVVGFAAESHNLLKHAQDKLIKKKIDLICANDISYPNQGFNSDYNQLHLLWNKGNIILPWNKKQIIAQQLISKIILHYNEYN